MFMLKHMGKQDIFEHVEATTWIYNTLISLLESKFCGLAYLCFGFFSLNLSLGMVKMKRILEERPYLKKK